MWHSIFGRQTPEAQAEQSAEVVTAFSVEDLELPVIVLKYAPRNSKPLYTRHRGAKKTGCKNGSTAAKRFHRLAEKYCRYQGAAIYAGDSSTPPSTPRPKPSRKSRSAKKPETEIAPTDSGYDAEDEDSFGEPFEYRTDYPTAAPSKKPDVGHDDQDVDVEMAGLDAIEN